MENTPNYPATEDRNTNISILVVDDVPVIREMIERRLQLAGYEVTTAASGVKAKPLIEKKHFDIVITDLIMPGEVDGIALLQFTKEMNPLIEVILITGNSSVETAVEAMKKGAFDYLEKPINFDELFLRLAKISHIQALRKNADDLREAMDVTESSAAETIRNLELLVGNLQAKLDLIHKTLRSNEDAGQKVKDVLAILIP